MSDVPGGFLVLPPRSWLDVKCFLRLGGICAAGHGFVTSPLVTKTVDLLLVVVSNFSMVFIFS